MSESTGANEYREIQVTVYPWQQGGQVSVRLRRHRGGSLIWDRRLGVFGLEGAAAAAVTTGAGAMRAAAASLLAAADRLDQVQ